MSGCEWNVTVSADQRAHDYIKQLCDAAGIEHKSGPRGTLVIMRGNGQDLIHRSRQSIGHARGNVMSARVRLMYYANPHRAKGVPYDTWLGEVKARLSAANQDPEGAEAIIAHLLQVRPGLFGFNTWYALGEAVEMGYLDPVSLEPQSKPNRQRKA